MNKILTAGLAALTLGGSVAMTTVPADAAPHGGYGGHGGSYHGGGYGGGYHGGGGYWRGGRWYGYGVGAGLAGFALGAAIADGGYYAGGPYGDCVAHRRVWDPYAGGWVMRPYYYAC